MKERLDDVIVSLNAKLLAWMTWLTSAIGISDIFDYGSKGVLFAISVIAGLLAMRNYVLKNRLLEKQNALMDQQIWKDLEETRKSKIISIEESKNRPADVKPLIDKFRDKSKNNG